MSEEELVRSVPNVGEPEQTSFDDRSQLFRGVRVVHIAADTPADLRPLLLPLFRRHFTISKVKCRGMDDEQDDLLPFRPVVRYARCLAMEWPFQAGVFL